MNNLAPMKNRPGGGVQGKLNWMPGYIYIQQNQVFWRRYPYDKNLYDMQITSSTKRLTM